MFNNVTSLLVASFAGTWIILGAISAVVFYFGRNVAFKRRWFAPFVILVGILFVGFSTAIYATLPRKAGQFAVWQELALIVPLTIVFTYLNLKLTRFCDACGATVFPRHLFGRSRFCPSCGVSLDGAKDADGSHGAS